MLEKFCCYIYYTYICIDFYWFRYHIFLKRNRTRLIRPVSTSFFLSLFIIKPYIIALL